MLYVAPSQLESSIAGLYTLDEIHKEEYVMDYSGKIQNQDVNDFLFMTSKINEFCNRKYEFTLDDQTEIDSVNVGNLSRFANNCFDSGTQQKKQRLFSQNVIPIRALLQHGKSESQASVQRDRVHSSIPCDEGHRP